MSYRRASIYYLTGTGNSYRAATWVKEALEVQGPEPLLARIGEAKPREQVQGSPEQLLVLVMPSHGFTAPWNMIKFACRLPRGRGAHAAVIATRAGIKFGWFHPPGMSGSGTFVIALLLALSGYRARGAFSVNMPSNWFSLHPMQSRKTHQQIIDIGRPKVKRFVDRILSGRRSWLTLSNVYEFISGLALLPVSVAYLLMGRFFLAKLFFANTKCNACELCVNSCPIGAIEMFGRKNPKPYWRYDCESCMRCAGFCPNRAIEAGHSWGVVIYFVTTPLFAYLFSLLGQQVPVLASIAGSWGEDLLYCVYFYPSLFASYFLFQLLLRVPGVRWLFAVTTLTHFWGRYREPRVKVKELVPPGALKKVKSTASASE